MSLITLNGGFAYRQANGSIFILREHLNYPIRFANMADASLTPPGSLFSYGRAEVEAGTAFLLDLEVIPPSEYVGIVKMEGDKRRGYITLTNYYDIEIEFEIQDLSTELQKQNMEGKLVSFQNIRFPGNCVYATNIQICTTPVSVMNGSLLAKVEDFYEEDNLLCLYVFFNEKEFQTFYVVPENPNFRENQIITVKANIKDNKATVIELQSIVDRRKGQLKEFQDTESSARIVDESNAIIKFRFNVANVEPSSLNKLANDKTVSYNLKYEHPNLIPYNIRVEN